MEKLISGIHRFRTQYWSENRELFQRLAEHGQSPEALFITCCDSRVDPHGDHPRGRRGTSSS